MVHALCAGYARSILLSGNVFTHCCSDVACCKPHLQGRLSTCKRLEISKLVLSPQAQVCAAGALLNILGPELERSKAGVMQRKGFGNIMSCLLTLSIAHEALFQGNVSNLIA